MVYEQDDQLLIRDMTAADPAIFDLEEQAQGWQPTLQKHLLRLSDQQAGRAIVLVAEIERHPVGYLSVYPGAEIREGEQRCELVDFGVLERYRCRGIGSRLMDAAERIAARYASTVWLAVGLHSGYGSAQRMYVKRGYLPDGTGAWYGGQPCTPYQPYNLDDDLVLWMSKQLDQPSFQENRHLL